MAIVDDLGVRATIRADYVALLETQFRTALASDLDLSSETPQGQLIGVIADALYEVDQALVSTANGLSLSAATGRQLDDIASLFGLRRLAATRTEVTATLAGVSGTVIMAGALAATEAGETFELVSAATIGAGNTVDAVMRATLAGPTAVAIGGLSRILTRVAGWESVTNAAAADPGRAAETDAELRTRYRSILGRTARTSLASMSAAVAGVAGVTDQRVVENNTAAEVTTQNIAVSANSILVIVSGGADADIGRAIAGTKAIGVGTSGDETVTVQGNTIRFRRAEDVPVSVNLQTVARSGFPSSGVSLIVDDVVLYVSELGIGNGLAANDLIGPAHHTIRGHTVSSVTVSRKAGGGGVATADLDLDQRLTLAAADVSVTVS